MTSEERIQAEQMRAMQRAMSFDVAAFRRIKELLNPSDAPPEARAHVEEIGEKICNLLDGVRLKAQARWMSEVKRTRMLREAKAHKAKQASARRKARRRAGPDPELFQREAEFVQSAHLNVALQDYSVR